MSISSRIHDTITQWAEEWGDRLRLWGARLVWNGIESTFDAFEPDFRKELTPSIERLSTIPNLPPDIKAILDKAKTEPKAVQFAFLLPLAVGMLLGAGFGMAQPMMKLGQYQVDKFVHSNRLSPEIAVRMLFRGFITRAYFDKICEEQGWSKEDIQAIFNVAHFYPTPQDLVNWQAKEVYEPEMRAKYGLDNEKEELKRDAFYKAGMDDEQIDNYWAAHWQHPALNTVFDLLHRQQITEEDMYRYYRLVEIPPLWRDKLTEISWDLPNRIELRMMARYGLVDKPYLVEQLKLVGLKEEFRDVAADMMLAMGIRTDLSTRYSKGWLTPDGVKEELKESKLSEPVQERMFQWIVKNTEGDRVQEETNLTKSEIYTGVKKGVITWEQGLDLLQDHNLTREEAEFVLLIRVGALEGSPETYQEFKKITQLWRRTQGLPNKIPSEDLIQAEKDVISTSKAVEQAQAEGIKRAKLTKLREGAEEAKLRYHQLLRLPSEGQEET